MVNRYMGILDSKAEARNVAFSDTGHKEQALNVFKSAIEKMPFWGIGYGQTTERLYLDGQTSNIHNTYATLWVQHGIVTLLFYLFIAAIIIKHTLRLMYKIGKHNFTDYLIYLLVGYYLIGYFASAWVNSGNVFMTFRFQVFWFLMFMYLTRCSGIKNESVFDQIKNNSGKHPLKRAW